MAKQNSALLTLALIFLLTTACSTTKKSPENLEVVFDNHEDVILHSYSIETIENNGKRHMVFRGHIRNPTNKTVPLKPMSISLVRENGIIDNRQEIERKKEYLEPNEETEVFTGIKQNSHDVKIIEVNAVDIDEDIQLKISSVTPRESSTPPSVRVVTKLSNTSLQPVVTPKIQVFLADKNGLVITTSTYRRNLYLEPGHSILSHMFFDAIDEEARYVGAKAISELHNIQLEKGSRISKAHLQPLLIN